VRLVGFIYEIMQGYRVNNTYNSLYGICVRIFIAVLDMGNICHSVTGCDRWRSSVY